VFLDDVVAKLSYAPATLPALVSLLMFRDYSSLEHLGDLHLVVSGKIRSPAAPHCPVLQQSVSAILYLTGQQRCTPRFAEA
jgi:hypothetical protein